MPQFIVMSSSPSSLTPSLLSTLLPPTMRQSLAEPSCRVLKIAEVEAEADTFLHYGAYI